MLAVLIVASTVERSGCSTSMLPLAATSAKWPRTVIIPRCLAENSACVWNGSNFHVPIAQRLLLRGSLLRISISLSLHYLPMQSVRRQGRRSVDVMATGQAQTGDARRHVRG